MATTETRSGFRLPWGADQRTEGGDAKGADAAAAAAPDGAATVEGNAWPSDDPAPTAGGATTSEAPDAPTEAAADHAPADAETDHEATETTQDAMLDTNAAPTGSAAKRPTKFLADLTKAMRVAAESEREEIVGRYQAEAKAFTELIQERSGTEATDLRKRADDDVASIRDWSKAEIARIREETDERIAHRRAKLDREVEAHAARIELEIERVKSAVDAFEKEMSLFFEELVSEEDPSRFASLAGHLPEPPSLDDAIAAVAASLLDETASHVAHDADEDHGGESVAEPLAEPDAEPSAETDAAASADTVVEPTSVAADDQAAAEPPTDAEELDPRMAALGLTPDFEAAEAEAMADVDGGDESADDSEPPIPALDDETIAARLAGLVPPTDDQAVETAETRLVVTGLVSVASIAGFKRHLARLAGVRSVGVSSGPDGEFVFTVGHDTTLDLREVVPTMPGFAARVTGSEDGTLTVSATDPESDS